MKRMLSLVIVTMIVGMSGPVLAHSGAQECLRASNEAPISAAAMKKKIDSLGYAVRRLTSGASCYQALMIDRDSGGRVRALFDMANGELVSAELAE